MISVLRETFTSESNIYRAKFSAITAPEITNAWRNMVKPDINLSLAVDARQELDLKIGVLFLPIFPSPNLHLSSTGAEPKNSHVPHTFCTCCAAVQFLRRNRATRTGGMQSRMTYNFGHILQWA